MNVSRALPFPLSLLLIFSLLLSACAIPSASPTPANTPTAQPAPREETALLPPTLAEASPVSGSEISLQPKIHLYFDQPMDKDSVEAALTFQPNLSPLFSWEDDATLLLSFEQPLLPDTVFTLTIGSNALAATGEPIPEPQTLTYRTAASLRVLQHFPQEETTLAPPDTLIAVTFSQPVVPLGEEESALDAFSLMPKVEGKGEWLNTSTYVFHPSNLLESGRTYRVILNPLLHSVDGAPLDDSVSLSWEFSVRMPALISISPEEKDFFPLDGAPTLTFNQPMNPRSVEEHFSFTAPSGEPVEGAFSWNEEYTEMTFTPSAPLARDMQYILLLDGGAQDSTGASLGESQQALFHTVPRFAFASSSVQDGGVLSRQGTIRLTFDSYLPEEETVQKYLSISPRPENLSLFVNENVLTLYGGFDPEKTYTLRLSANLSDAWGQKLGRAVSLHWSIEPPEPSLTLPFSDDSSLYFTDASDPVFKVKAVNIHNLSVTLAPLPNTDFFYLVSPDTPWEARTAYVPSNAQIWSISPSLTPNRSEVISIPLSADEEGLLPGLYYFRAYSSEVDSSSDAPVILVASRCTMLFKIGATDALIWATDIETGAPIVHAPVSIYDARGNILASGETDENGIWHPDIPAQANPYHAFYALMGEAGTDNFGMAAAAWGERSDIWRFGISESAAPPQTKVYFYTDRPIYRPGQTVHFKAVVRYAYDGLYTLSGMQSLAFSLEDGNGKEIATFNLPLSEYGTAHGDFQLPESAAPGYYLFRNSDLSLYTSFQVAEYRKPEINLSVAFTPDEVQQGDSLQAHVNARYFFDAPAGDLAVHWALYDQPGFFPLSGYVTGEDAPLWAHAQNIYPFSSGREAILEGDARTNDDGTLDIPLSNLDVGEGTRSLTLEVTAEDESGLPVSASASATIHPADIYIGVSPDSWIGRVGQEMGFDIKTVDWTESSVPEMSLRASFQRVTWEENDEGEDTPVYTLVGSSDFVTGADGGARIAFTPPSAGVYALQIEGGRARTSIFLWVGGALQRSFPRLPSQHIVLAASQSSYQAGDLAQIFIPNPFGESVPALITVERSTIHLIQQVEIPADGMTFLLPLTNTDAPNVYFSVTLVKERDYRIGYLNLEVAPKAQTLLVSLTSQPTHSEPGGEVTFGIRVTDSEGAPVQGEFSLSVVDLATLALAEPNTENILDAFYSTQPLGLRTALSLQADANVKEFPPPIYGLGGGGDMPREPSIREDFPDTAYWNAVVLTDENGEATVHLTLPDNLTTWDVLARGVTTDTRVGEAEMQLVSTKDLLIRPVTPRFFVEGDHAEVSAILHNNTASTLRGTVTLQAIGFLLDAPETMTQQVEIPANGRVQVTWWGVVQEDDAAELLFSAECGDYQDITRPVWGSIPILKYTAPQTFVTAGALMDAGSRLEVVNLPRSFVPVGGGLRVETAPSLDALLSDSVSKIPAPKQWNSNEAILSRILPAMVRGDSSLSSADIQEAVSLLVNRQNSDGGWGWRAAGTVSDSYISAYLYWGLHLASQFGYTVPAETMEGAELYLQQEMERLRASAVQPNDANRLAFLLYALQQGAGVLDGPALRVLQDHEETLSPWAKAFLALAIDSQTPGAVDAREIFSALEAAAVRSSSGAYWESGGEIHANPGSTELTTAMVLYALAKENADSPLVTDGARFLLNARASNGLWDSNYATAWAFLALTEISRQRGEDNADFSYTVTLNDSPFLEGGGESLAHTAYAPLDSLYLSFANALNFWRGEGNGVLYYRATLQVDAPVDSAKPLRQGMEVQRAYYDAACETDCSPVTEFLRETGSRIQARVTLILPHDSYYVVVEDYIPAGTEILDQSLRTSERTPFLYDSEAFLHQTWTWWYFSAPEIYDDHIVWSAPYLPAGTYTLTYTLIPTMDGEYRVLPARAWETYFPEVQGSSAGTIFTIRRMP